jgi:adenosyl cobinamide kinase/adenosyl cobinamide phosphate guanylyltransferase
MYKVNNLSNTYHNYKYAVIRDCNTDGYWYYGAYNNLQQAIQVANEIGNGVVVETNEITNA